MEVTVEFAGLSRVLTKRVPATDVGGGLLLPPDPSAIGHDVPRARRPYHSPELHVAAVLEYAEPQRTALVNQTRWMRAHRTGIALFIRSLPGITEVLNSVVSSVHLPRVVKSSRFDLSSCPAGEPPAERHLAAPLTLSTNKKEACHMYGYHGKILILI